MTSLRPSAPAWLVMALALLVASLFTRLAEAEPVISDPIGYLYAAERLAQGEGPTYEDAHDAIAGPYFVLYAFQVMRPGDPAHYLGFPPGFALLLAPGAAVGAAHVVTPLLAALTLAAAYFLGKYLTDAPWVGLWAAVLLAGASAFWQFGTAAWSEIPAALAATAGIALYLRSRRGDHRLFFSLAAASVLAFGHFIRYTNVVFLAAPALYELYTARRGLWSERWRWPFWLAVLVGLTAIPLFNHFYYGGALLTSYSPTHGWYPLPPFAPAYALGPSFVDGYSLRESLKTLWANFPLTLLLAPAGWWLLPRGPRLLVGAAVGFGLLPYVVYAFAPAGINSRFLLPVFPFLGVAIAQFIVVALRRLNRPLRLAAGLALAIAVFLPVPGHVAAINERNAASRATVETARAFTAGLEQDAVVLSYAYNDLIAVYGNRAVLNYRRIPASDAEMGRYRLEMLEPCLVGAVDRLLARSVPVYAVVEQSPANWDTQAILQRHFTLGEPAGNPPVVRIQSRAGDTPLDESACPFP